MTSATGRVACPPFVSFHRSIAHHDTERAPSLAEKPALVPLALPQRVGEIDRRFLRCVSSNPMVRTSAPDRTVSRRLSSCKGHETRTGFLVLPLPLLWLTAEC